MQELLKNLQIKVNENIYLKDPESSELGKRIIQNSILLIEDIGFEAFTFKKLGDKIKSPEASVYRYFENKHKLLLYLTSWYWAWIEYQLVIQTFSISNNKEKLSATIDVITKSIQTDSNFSHIDEVKLNTIVVNENSKSFLTKEVDDDNKEGYFSIYKRLITRVKDAIIAVSPAYLYPASLASTVVEGSLHQHFLKEHFPTITDCDGTISPKDIFKNLVFNVLKISE
ncbi:TetR/AcrR family transcriptional regulator [Marinirhabdus gelatinilytica]|uniref:TetR family transcriptional regulator n=1 Tax=Marinirhabdus gelatinilytica TaxID=1703343 RepID=A0A370Q4G0_9FLAO|nr:TetR/AcrR family transcriptional regulator [Marinirhabdus gelatinilytica]RDK83262.1 TetR family transcriptional regulator [Marinirhabdus gelatinilytica]